METNMKRTMVAILTTVFLTGSFARVWADEAAPAPAMAPQTEAAPTEQMAPVPAATAGSDEDKWTFNSPLYMWAPALNGHVTARGQGANVNQSFTDLYDHLDKGLTAYFELAKPQYGFYVAPNYYDLTFDGKVNGSKASLNTQLWIIDIMGEYRIWNLEGDRPASLYLLGGVRYWNLHNNLRINGSGRAADGSWLLDPTIGLRFHEYITKRVHFMTQADMGGFGMGQQTSRFSWEFMANVGYDFTMPVIKKPSTFFLGWRQINGQHHQGSNSYNLTFSGPQAGLNVQLF
jgi:hypothetical protein